MRFGGACSMFGEGRGAYRILVGRPEGRRPLGRYKYRWKDTIKIDIQEIGLGNIDWIDVAQDRGKWWVLVNAVTTFGFNKMR
jgi:hypothetical protein